MDKETKPLIAALMVMAYGHMDHDGPEVAIDAKAWECAAGYLDESYPDVARVLRKVAAKTYLGSAAAEAALVDDTNIVEDAYGITYAEHEDG